ncbi:MAG: hypothetical protein AB1782_02970 [Cyanobacteriota bacterium]
MTSTAFVNVSSQAVSSQSNSVKNRDDKKKDDTVRNNESKAESKSLINSVAELDNKIEKLEKEAEKSSGSWFGKVYNVFSKKDNSLEKELEELKAAKKAAQADGVVTKEELAKINKEYTEADSSLDTYKKGKKKAADTTSTVAAIGAGVVAGVATGGASLVVGAAVCAAASGVAKVATKEGMLGDEYQALGKEGLTDGAISAVYGAAGGVVGAAAKAVAPAIGQGAARMGVTMTEATAQTVAKYGTKVVADEALMIGIKKANGQDVSFGDVLATGAASLTFTKVGNTLSKTKLFGVTENTESMVKVAKVSTVATATYIGKKEMSHLIDS